MHALVPLNVHHVMVVISYNPRIYAQVFYFIKK